MTFDVLSDINYLAAIVAAIAAFAVGALWYSPLLFAKPWMKAIGINPDEPQSPDVMLFAGTAIAYFLQAIVLDAIALHTGASTVSHGIVMGVFVGVGIVATQLWVNGAYEKRPGSLFWINAGMGVLAFVVMSVIVTTWN